MPNSADNPPDQALGHKLERAAACEPAAPALHDGAPTWRMAPPPPAPPTVRVVSPCVRLCTLNEHDLCLGCGRSMADITGWMAMTDEQKTDCVARGRDNLTRMGRPLPPYPPYPLTPVVPRRR